MIIRLTPQPTRWGNGWLYLNELRSHAEMQQRFSFCNGVWYEAVIVTPQPLPSPVSQRQERKKMRQ